MKEFVFSKVTDCRTQPYKKRIPLQMCFKEFAKILVTLSQLISLILEKRLLRRTSNSGCICSKQKFVQSKMFQQGLFAPILTCHFRQVFVHQIMSYFDVRKITRWLPLSTSRLGIPLRCDLFRKGMGQEKFPFMATTN